MYVCETVCVCLCTGDGETSNGFFHHCCDFQSSIGVNLFRCCFLMSCCSRRVAFQYANVLFFKKCYCTVNIIMYIFVSS